MQGGMGILCPGVRKHDINDLPDMHDEREKIAPFERSSNASGAEGFFIRKQAC